jgi:hypothetical protein
MPQSEASFFKIKSKSKQTPSENTDWRNHLDFLLRRASFKRAVKVFRIKNQAQFRLAPASNCQASQVLINYSEPADRQIADHYVSLWHVSISLRGKL